MNFPRLSCALLGALLPFLSTNASGQASTDPELQARREAEFAERLSGARLVGYTTLGDSAELKADSYQLRSVHKQEDGRWVFEAVIEFGGRAVPLAMPLPVVWADDTPVISVTNLAFPLMGTYSARVLFYEDHYVGVWSGKDHGGQMFGRIEKSAPADAKAGGEGSRPTEKGAGGGEAQGGDATRGGKPTQVPATRAPAAQAASNAASGGAHMPRPGIDWPGFRGIEAAGVSDGFATPVAFDVEGGKNVRWRAELPGLAHSSPIVFGDRLFVTTAVRQKGDQELKVGLYGSIAPVADDSEFGFVVLALDKRSGEILWEQTAWEGVPEIKRHPKGSHAASTPASDGRHVLASFGSEGLYCYDVDGKLLWKKSLGKLDSGYYLVPDAQWGYASSPVLHDGLAIVQCDVQGEDFVAAFDAETGAERWRTAREEVPTWSTPTVSTAGEREQVICNGYKRIASYDLRTGKELWSLVGGGDIPVPTPIVAEDLIFITNAHGPKAPIYAIDVRAEGELAEDAKAMAWSEDRRGNYMQTPLAYGEEVYFCSDAGILAAYDVRTGEEKYRERLGGGTTGFTASGVAADGKLYFTSEEGDVYCVRAGTTFELLGTSSLGEECMASPAVSQGVLYFRSRNGLLAVGE